MKNPFILRRNEETEKMSVNRLKNIPGFSIDQVARAAANDPEILRLENLDTDLAPPYAAVIATKAVIGEDQDNSYLPFIGKGDLRIKVAEKINRQIGEDFYDEWHVVVTCGATEGMLDALLALTDPGDEILLTDPTYAGMIQRVRLVGAEPVLVPFYNFMGMWRLDVDKLVESVTDSTKAIFLMNPSTPSGAVLNEPEWKVIADLCRERNLLLIYNAAMERILYDNLLPIHPCTLPGMKERTIIIGSMSKEFRMIGWRVGWVVAPKSVINDIARVHIYNTVTATGISQAGAIAALRSPEDGLGQCLMEWQKRRDVMNRQLKGYPMISAAGGWSQLLDVGQLGYDADTASQLLLERGKIAATPMNHWGKKNSTQYIRLVFSNESLSRLSSLRNRVKLALG